MPKHPDVILAERVRSAGGRDEAEICAAVAWLKGRGWSGAAEFVPDYVVLAALGAPRTAAGCADTLPPPQDA